MSQTHPRSTRYRVYVAISAGIVLVAVASLVAALISGSPRVIATSGVVIVATLALYLWTRQRNDI